MEEYGKMKTRMKTEVETEMKTAAVTTWFDNLLDPSTTPSSTSLICLFAGVVGVMIAIISSFVNTSDGVELSKFLVIVGIGGKLGQGLSRSVKNE